ncbi:MAG: lysine--tRNA ligase [Armatimonadota bacterium]|nr:lysine--tRNA ligase [Armatimonadota bacterium]
MDSDNIILDENDLIQARRQKLAELRARGIDPFKVEVFERRLRVAGEERAFPGAAGVIEEFEKLESEPSAQESDQASGVHTAVAGRVVAMREMGKAAFAHIEDESGRIQVYLRIDKLGEEVYSLVRLLDLGDFVGVAGDVFRTRTGEVTVAAQTLQILSKSLRPAPLGKQKGEEKYSALEDPEQRRRQRYLDLMVNREVRSDFRVRADLIAAIRRLLNDRGFMEVETPTLQPIPGGAAAKPFITHHNALDVDLYLRIAPELYLKRLIVGGFERVFEICKNFRNEGISFRHNPEFTMLEVYQAYADYNGIMELAEQLVAYAAEQSLGTTKITYQGNEIDLTPPWRRLNLFEAIREYAGVDFADTNDEAVARERAKKAGVDMDGVVGYGKIVDEVLKTLIMPKLIQPTFLIEYPVELSPLAKRDPDNPRLTHRFQPFLGGLEVGNAFSELNDPIDQRERFEAQMAQKAKGDEEAHPFDEDFVRALEYGMPPTGGLGLGIDRLVMAFTDKPSIRDVILFPQMKPEGK